MNDRGAPLFFIRKLQCLSSHTAVATMRFVWAKGRSCRVSRIWRFRTRNCSPFLKSLKRKCVPCHLRICSLLQCCSTLQRFHFIVLVICRSLWIVRSTSLLAIRVVLKRSAQKADRCVLRIEGVPMLKSLCPYSLERLSIELM